MVQTERLKFDVLETDLKMLCRGLFESQSKSRPNIFQKENSIQESLCFTQVVIITKRAY